MDAVKAEDDSNGSFKLELNVEGSEDNIIIEGGR